MTRLATVGAGLMGEAILSGLLASGWAAADLAVCDTRPERLAELNERHGIEAVTLAEAGSAEMVLIAVKPADVTGVLDELADHLGATTAILSIAAGVTLATLESALPAGTPVVRAMPNTPARVGEGVTAISPGTHATAEHLTAVTEVLTTIGRVVTVAEKYQDAVTAVSGSGPAYIFLVAEAMIEGGVHCGLSRDIATELAVQTLFGSATLLRESGEHPAILRENVTSPGGTTAAALRQLEDYGMRAAFLAAIEAARNRAVELG